MILLFWQEVKQRNGKAYTSKLILQISMNLPSYVNTQGQESSPLMIQEDIHYKHIHNVVDNVFHSYNYGSWQKYCCRGNYVCFWK